MISSKKKHIIFLVPSIEQPRVIKRIIEKSRSYDQCIVYAFSRTIYNVNNYLKFDEYENINLEIIGQFENKFFIKRISLYLKLVLLLNFRNNFTKKNIYAFGFDMRFISFFTIKSQITYEISDIMWLYKSPKLRYILSKIDFLLSKKSRKVVFTSKGFYKKYFHFLNRDKVLIAENKLKIYGKVRPIENIKKDKIRIAYIGAFRYPNIISALIEVCVNYKDKVELNFYGDGPTKMMDELKSKISEFQNVNYLGAFKNPEDLENIYAQTNVNFVAYDNSKDNEKVAMPNKFYESGFFNIPIVCSKKTYVGECVDKLEMGWVIQPSLKGINKFVKEITVEDIIYISDRIKKIDKSQFSLK